MIKILASVDTCVAVEVGKQVAAQVEKNTPHISIKAEEIFNFFGFPITNSLLTSWIVLLLLIIVAIQFRQQKGPVYHAVNILLKGLYELFMPILGERAQIFFPIVMSFFLYIFALNWFGLLPGIGTVGFEGEHGFIPFFRGGTADLNTTLALTLVGMFLIQFYSIKYVGFVEYIQRFFNFSNPINAFVGILEIVSEFSKILSFSFRLFGNIFAGEVLMTVISFLVPVLASLPFLLFEFFVGFIQALVFTMLLSIFITVGATSHKHH